jgi:hypothetical protein
VAQPEIPDQEAWDAWHPGELARRLAGIDRPWCVVGGWALDLWHGRVTREHHDLEFTVLRKDFGRFRKKLINDEAPLIPLPGPSPRSDGEKGDLARTALHLPSPRLRGEGGGSRVRGESAARTNMAFYTVNSGVFQRLPDHAEPHPSISQIWCWDLAARSWRVDIMIEPGTPETWTCKRDHTITLPRAEAVLHSPDGIPYLGPAAILLLKAKHQRPKDEADFEMAFPKLEQAERAWLKQSLARLHPAHVWIEKL